MARPRKNVQEELDDTPDDLDGPAAFPPSTTTSKPLCLDINKLVSAVKGRYAKKQSLADSIRLGSDIILSDKDSDYVLSDEISYWKPLTGIKGIPFGRIVQIAGKPDSGKSTTAMVFMKAAQQQGHLVILWNSEKKFSTKRYNNNIKGDADNLAVVDSKTIVEGAQQVSLLVKLAKEQSPAAKIFIVWDSVGATLNSSEDKEDDDYTKQPGVTAREVSWAIKKFNKLIERYRNVETGEETVAVLCVNQVYATIGAMAKGDKEKGGQELEFLSSLILRLTRKKELTRIRGGQKMKYGILTKAKVKKNHLFDGEDCIAELDLVVSADGIKLAEEVKAKGKDITGWDDDDEGDE